MPQGLTEGLAVAYARLALGHVRREYPNHLSHTLTRDADAATPRDLHPTFYGSLDWHSCVHGYWLLARLWRRFPQFAPARDIEALFEAQLTAPKLAAERAYFERSAARGFERPYGWAWLLKLASELPPPWDAEIADFARLIAGRFRDFLPRATYPIRSGAHMNTAFALRLAADYAEGAGDDDLREALAEAAHRWYGADAACPAWGEPSLDDFLSPALIEAECMRRLLPSDAFLVWFDRFLPDLARREPAALFAPAAVSDRSDGKIAHLDGLNLSRAWGWRSLAAALPQGDPRAPILREAAERHLAAALPHVAGDYMGEHWLATFALLALEADPETEA